MMEVMQINTNDTINSKADLLADRVHAFRKSGLSRKDWCRQNDVPQSTLGYWIRKTQLESHMANASPDLLFAKIPSEQEFCFNTDAGNPPVVIHFPDDIRIEVGADCPARLIAALLQALKNHA